MSTAPVFIVHDGKLANTEDLQELGLVEGMKLFLVSASAHEIVLRREQPKPVGYGPAGLSLEEYMAGWRSLRGILKDGVATTEEREREKAEERSREIRKWGR